jgi:hypothetical protein
MHHALGQARQPRQGGRLIQIAQQWRDALIAQSNDPIGAGSQGQHPDAVRTQARDSQADITATHNQDAGATETGGQGTQRGKV